MANYEYRALAKSLGQYRMSADMKQKLPAIAIALSVTTLIMGILLVNNHHKAQKAIQLKGGQINRLTTEKDDLTKDKAVVEDKLEAKETAKSRLIL